MKKQTQVPADSTDQAVSQVAAMTPFEGKDLKGQKFAKGNMLGGASVAEQSADKPAWLSKK